MSDTKSVSENQLLARFGRFAEDSDLFLLLEFLSWTDVRRGKTEPYAYFLTNGVETVETEKAFVEMFNDGKWNRLQIFQSRCAREVQNRNDKYFVQVAEIVQFLKTRRKESLINDPVRFTLADAYFSFFPHDREKPDQYPTILELTVRMEEKLPHDARVDVREAREMAKQMGMKIRKAPKGPQ
jgi:hypothetical protein